MHMVEKKSAKPVDSEKSEPKAKRKMLTPEEKVAKLERELQAAREKAQGKDRKRFAQVTDELRKISTKISELQLKADQLGGERDEIVARVPELVNDQPTTEA